MAASCITRFAVAGSRKLAFPKEEFVIPKTGKEGVRGFHADMTPGRAVNTGVLSVAGHLLRMGTCALCYGMPTLSLHALYLEFQVFLATLPVKI